MAWTPGQQLQEGNYRIEKVLGEGGFGITYLATSQQYGSVVIKTLNDEVQKRRDFDRFQDDFMNEALAISRCQHRHIVKVHRFFTERVRHPNPGSTLSQYLKLTCMVMECIQGADLADLVQRKGKLSEVDALRYIQQVGQALSVVHGQGLLHRDVKPNNIMVRRDTDEAVLIDFGIAREFTPNLTRTHTQFMTDGYAPIEQYEQQAKRGAFTDVYALAATLYVLVTGEVPPNSTQRENRLLKHQRDLLEAPQTKNRAISDRVNAAIMKGMAIQPEYRPQSMAEWLDMLELSPNVGPTTVPPQPISPLSNQQTPIVAPGPNHRPGMSAPPKTKPKIIQNPPPQSPFSAAPTPVVAPGMNHRPASPVSPGPKPIPQFVPTPQPVKSVTPSPTPVVPPVQSPGPAKVARQKGAAPVQGVGRDRRRFLQWLGLGSVGFVTVWRLRPRSQPTGPVLDPVQTIPSLDGDAQGGGDTTASSSGLPLQRITLDKDAVDVDGQGNIVKTYPVMVDTFVEDLGNGVTFTMVQIPAGTFMMGSPNSEVQRFDDEGPQHQVTVPSFLMGMVTVTQAVYEAVMGANPATGYDADRFVNPNKPVVGVSWNDADTFCQKLSERTGKNYRLPSEAEWEYACRAGTTTPFHFGPTLTTDLANYYGDSTYGNGPKGEYRKQTTPVGNFPPNAFGLFEMHGNVWEWCADHWHENYEGAPSDGSVWLENISQSNNTRVTRGGSWFYPPRFCRSACRLRNFPDDQYDGVGFRVVLAPR